MSTPREVKIQVVRGIPASVLAGLNDNVTAAASSANAASVSATAASASQIAAASSATTATTQATNASNSAIASEQSAVNAASAATTAANAAIAPFNTSYNDSIKLVFGEEYLSAFHKKLVARSNTIVSLSGDSTTYGYLNSAPYTLTSLLANDTSRNGYGKYVSYLNRGHNAETSAQWLSSHLASDLAENPDLYVIRWGLNDLPLGSISIAQTIANLRSGLTTIRASKTPAQMSIILMSCNSTYSATWPGGADENIVWHKTINQLVRALAREFECCFIDTFGLFPDSKNGYDFYQADLVHPNDAFNCLISSHMFNVMFPTTLNNTRYLETPIAPTLLNSWVNVGAGTPGAGYYRDNSGVVYLRGVVKTGTIGQPIFQLPAGYRPLAQEIFIVDSNNTSGILSVMATGDVVCTVGNNAGISLSGVSFRTDI